MVSPKAEMVGIAVTTAALGVAVVLLGLTVTDAGRVLLFVCGALAIALSAIPLAVARTRFGPATRLPAALRDTNRGAPALYTLVLQGGGRARAAVFRGGYALVPVDDAPVDAREVVSVEPTG